MMKSPVAPRFAQFLTPALYGQSDARYPVGRPRARQTRVARHVYCAKGGATMLAGWQLGAAGRGQRGAVDTNWRRYETPTVRALTSASLLLLGYLTLAC